MIAIWGCFSDEARIGLTVKPRSFFDACFAISGMGNSTPRDKTRSVPGLSPVPADGLAAAASDPRAPSFPRRPPRRRRPS